MTKCPQCNKSMDFDFLHGIMDKLAEEIRGSNLLTYEFEVKAQCCGKMLKAMNEVGRYTIISSPAKSGETPKMIGHQ